MVLLFFSFKNYISEKIHIIIFFSTSSQYYVRGFEFKYTYCTFRETDEESEMVGVGVGGEEESRVSTQPQAAANALRRNTDK